MIVKPLNPMLSMFLVAGLLALSGCASAPSLPARQAQTLTTLGFDKIEDGWKLTLPEHVLFEFDKEELKPGLRESVTTVSRQLLAVEIRQVRVEGHTDNIGTREYNQALSLRRANHVAEVLVAEGFAEANVERKGYGPDRPIAKNSSDEGRAENRRVEIIVLSNALSPQ